jgi:hypothetical protein
MHPAEVAADTVSVPVSLHCAVVHYSFFLTDGRGRPSLAGHAHNSRVNPAAGGPRQSLTRDHRDATQPHFYFSPTFILAPPCGCYKVVQRGPQHSAVTKHSRVPGKEASGLGAVEGDACTGAWHHQHGVTGHRTAARWVEAALDLQQQQQQQQGGWDACRMESCYH